MASVWLAGLSAGVVAIGATVAVERLGGRLGGLLGTLPTTIVPAAAGIWLATEDAGLFAASMGAVPVGMWINVVFLQVWRTGPRHLPAASLPARLGAMVILSLAVWSSVASAAVVGMRQLPELSPELLPGPPAYVLGVAATLVSAGLGLRATWHSAPAPKGRRKVGVVTLLARGLLAALAIAGAVGLASVAGPLVSGVASVFPAIFLTSMVSLWWSQGEGVQGGAVGPMMLGASSVSAYALFAARTIPHLGVWMGSVAAWGLAVALITVPAFVWLQWRTATQPSMGAGPSASQAVD